jgi:anti-sigma28 factor (negative regulator of flagellin synthesis)
MRIDPRIDPRISVSENPGISRATDGQPVAPKSSSPATASSAASEPVDTVQLSAGQATVASLASQLAHVPDTRELLVSALRSQVESGQFERGNGPVAGAVVSEQFSANT